MNHTWCILQKYLNKMTSVIITYHNCSMSPFLKDHPPQQPVALELAQVRLSSSSMEFSYFFVKSKVPNSELMDKTMEWNFKTIFYYMGNPRLLLTPIFLLLLVILDISDPPYPNTLWVHEIHVLKNKGMITFHQHSIIAHQWPLTIKKLAGMRKRACLLGCAKQKTACTSLLTRKPNCFSH